MTPEEFCRKYGKHLKTKEVIEMKNDIYGLIRLTPNPMPTYEGRDLTNEEHQSFIDAWEQSKF